jgi:hypothetical protein
MIKRFVTIRYISPVRDTKNPEKYWINAMKLKKEKNTDMINRLIHKMMFTRQADLNRAIS